VAAALGSTQIEYDEQTLEFTLNVQGIRNAIKRSELFVAFLSENSIHSEFVKEENRSALEARGRGELRHVLVFALDKTSYTALPEWMQEINVVRHLSAAKACARCIPVSCSSKPRTVGEPLSTWAAKKMKSNCAGRSLCHATEHQSPFMQLDTTALVAALLSDRD
jgi:hypothetical protein